MRKRNRRKLTIEEKANIEILASLIIMGGALIFVIWCIFRAIEVSL